MIVFNCSVFCNSVTKLLDEGELYDSLAVVECLLSDE